MAGNANVRVRMLYLGAAIVVCGVVAASLFAGGAEGADGGRGVVKWEHLALTDVVSKTELRSAERSEDGEPGKTINRLGREGWELVSVANFAVDGTTSKTVYYFKRRM